MPPIDLRVQMDPASRNATRNVGIVLLLIGLAGIALPQVMAVVLSLLLGWLLLAGGIFFAFVAWQGYRDRGTAWLKAFLLVALGLLILLNPKAGASALGLVLAIYFLFDGFAGAAFGLDLRPHPGWIWMLLNGVLSLVLAVVILAGWPFSAVWVVGLLVGISLFFDGLALVLLALAARRP